MQIGRRRTEELRTIRSLICSTVVHPERQSNQTTQSDATDGIILLWLTLYTMAARAVKAFPVVCNACWEIMTQPNRAATNGFFSLIINCTAHKMKIKLPESNWLFYLWLSSVEDIFRFLLFFNVLLTKLTQNSTLMHSYNTVGLKIDAAETAISHSSFHSLDLSREPLNLNNNQWMSLIH